MTRLNSRLIALLALILLAVACVPGVALALDSPNDPSSTELVEQPEKYDGTEITFEGEAIGERMVRGADAWIHLNDDAYMYKNVEEGAALGGYNTGMPVWIAAGLTEKIEFFGTYKHQGDIVRVTGTFNAACAQHGGDMDIHATTLEMVTPGRYALDPVKPWKVVTALGLTLAAAGMWYSERRVSHRERRGLARRT